MIHEAVRILTSASMNSKTEHKSYKITRLKAEPSEWESKKELEKAELITKAQEAEMLQLRERAVVNNKRVTNVAKVICRKRKMESKADIKVNAEVERSFASASSEMPSPIVKKLKQTQSTPDNPKKLVVKTKYGQWSGKRQSKSKFNGAKQKSVVDWLKPSKSSTPAKPPVQSCDTQGASDPSISAQDCSVTTNDGPAECSQSSQGSDLSNQENPSFPAELSSNPAKLS